MNPQVFREYDIRGVVEDDFDDDFVVESRPRLRDDPTAGGQAHDHARPRLPAVLGPAVRDCSRRSAAGGINVVDIGVVPTPLLYFSVLHWQMDGGAMITGSHNAAEYNGFKLGRRTDDDLWRRNSGAPAHHRARRFSRHRRPGHAERAPGACPTTATTSSARSRCAGAEGRGRRRQRLRRSGRGAADARVGAGDRRTVHRDGRALSQSSSGPDGRGEHARSASRRSRSSGAGIGIAYDGDADRIGAVDENGRIVWGDELMVVFSRAILKERPGATIIGDVKCSQRMYDDIAAHGGRADHVEDRPFADQEQAQGGARGAGRRDERAHVFRRSLLSASTTRSMHRSACWKSSSREGRGLGAILADLPRAASRRRFASIVPMSASSRSCARPPTTSARTTR